MSAIAQSKTQTTMQTEPKTRPEKGGSTSDVKFDLDDKQLTLYIRPDKRMSIDANNMGLPEEIRKEFASEGFWESKMGQMIEHQIISNMSDNSYLYIGYKNGYFVGFDCIQIVNWLNRAINERQDDTKRLITKVVVSDAMKPHINFAVRGLNKFVKKPVTTKKIQVDGPEGSKQEKDVEMCYECDLHYDDSGNLMRNISTLEKMLLKEAMKKIDHAPNDVLTEFMNGVEEEVNKKQGDCDCCQGPE
tara:strand:+ start:127 stop:864 length:738 start_codon:yes stop_codon:yes gene_type:complete